MITFQFLPFSELSSLSREERINRILKIVINNNIVLIDGKLKPEEETELIQITMQKINKKFKGIEIGSIAERQTKSFKSFLLKTLFKERSGFTIIGPATIIKDIKQDPNKLQLFANIKNRR